MPTPEDATMPRPSAVSMLGPARTTREKVESFVPIITFKPVNDVAYIAILDGGMDLSAMLRSALPQMRDDLGMPEWVALTADTFVLHYTGDAPVGYPPEGLAEAFANGDPRVIEQLVVVVVGQGGFREMASQTYRYLPSEGWEWQPPQVDEYASGRIVDLLAYALDHGDDEPDRPDDDGPQDQ